MSNKKAIIILAAGAVFILLHFLLLSFYLVKPNNLSVKYCYPYFHQSWNLFVPPPNCNYNLYVYFPQKEKSNAANTTLDTTDLKYFDVFDEIVENHQKNRLKGYEPLLIALSNSIHYFEKEAEEQKFTAGKVEHNVNFDIIEKFVKNYVKVVKHNNTNGLKMILLVNPTNNGKQRVYYN